MDLNAHFYHISPLLKVSSTLGPSLLSGLLTEKRITQRNLLNSLHIRIVHKIRINIEENRHIHRLPSVQSLFLKAEALNLAKIRSNLSWRNTIRRYPNNIL